MKRIVWTDAAGRTCVTTPAPDGRLITKVIWGGVEVALEPTPLDRLKLAAASAGVTLEILNGESDDDHVARVLTNDLFANAKNVRIVDSSEIPAKDIFRNAWRHDLTVDMSSAREIWRNEMRRVRAGKLAALDVEYQRADEAGDAALKPNIAARKQALRDVTKHPGIDAAKTPDELKTIWPEDLK